MARGKSNGESVSGYFRKVFEERADWLDGKSNDAILRRYREDHDLAPGAEIDKKIKQNLANLKSVMRKQGRKKRRGRPRKDATAMVRTAAVAVIAVPAAARKAPAGQLDSLEEMIDDCLTMARNQDREGLRDVIVLLRRARNAVVWKIGQ